MIFEKKEPKFEPETSKVSGNPVSTIRNFYTYENMDLLLNVGNMLRDSNFIVKCDEVYYLSSYLGECLIFLNTGIGEISTNTKFSITKKQYFSKKLPVMSGFKVELTPQQTIVYAVEAVSKCPTPEFVKIAPYFYEFAKEFMSDDIQSALSVIAER